MPGYAQYPALCSLEQPHDTALIYHQISLCSLSYTVVIGRAPQSIKTDLNTLHTPFSARNLAQLQMQCCQPLDYNSSRTCCITTEFTAVAMRILIRVHRASQCALPRTTLLSNSCLTLFHLCKKRNAQCGTSTLYSSHVR